MKNRLLKTLLILGSLTFVSCNANSEPKEPTEPIDYGTVKFSNITVYNGYDGVKIEPIFSNPVACKDEKFTYEISDEENILIEDDCVYYYGEAKSVVCTAKSEHFEETFYINALENFENNDFSTKARSRTIDRKGVSTGTNLFMGDSFFEFWQNKIGITESFGTAFAGEDVCNIGISATQTKHWRAYVYKLVAPYEPKNIIINIGINDIDDANQMGVNAADNVLSLVKQVHDACSEAKIYWFTLTQCAGTFASKWPQYQLCNAYVKNYESNLDYFKVLDIASLYGDDYASLEQDGLHPNQNGYNLFKQLIDENVQL